jgi:hypothetical protein
LELIRWKILSACARWLSRELWHKL